MQVVFADFESYYDRDFSLSKMTPVEYILDPRFEAIGAAFQTGVGGRPFWVDGPDLADYFKSLDPNVTAMVTHNALFDMCIAAWRYSFIPRLMIDTLGVSRACLAHELRSHSLAKVAAHLGLPPKGDTVMKVIGMNRAAIKQAGLWDEYTEYCLQDVRLCAGIYEKLVVTGKFPRQELIVMDTVLRCAVQPQLELDTALLAEHLDTVINTKQTKLAQAMLVSGLTDKSQLMSNDLFAALLESLGVNPPLKISPTTRRPTYAFSKQDEDFIALTEHEDLRVQLVVAARLGHRSTLEEKRTERLLSMARVTWPGNRQGLAPVPLRFAGAHTGRLSGDWKINMQNMPRGGNLRRALRAPDGFKVVVADAAQIEARIVAWICGQYDLVKQFANGEDVYSNFASEIFGRTITKQDAVERFVGKTCVAEGTPVVTMRGNVPIEDITTDDLLWDGEEWVCHQGLVSNGLKETLPLCGIWLTPDHLVWSGTEWLEAASVQQDASILSQALGTAAANLPSQAISKGALAGSWPSSSGATVDGRSTPSTTITSKRSAARAVTSAPTRLPRRSDTGSTPTLSRMTSTVLASLTGWLPRLPAATALVVECSSITAGAVSQFIRNGGTIGPLSYATFRPSLAGLGPTTRWTGSTPTGITSRGTSASLVAATTYGTSARSKISKRRLPVYDIACSGPRNRFTVMTEAGPLIVHNCILGLGYGVGAPKFAATVRLQSQAQTGTKIDMSLVEAQKIVDLYRTINFKIPDAWDDLNAKAIPRMAGRSNDGVKFGPVEFIDDAAKLPNGHLLRYPSLLHDGGGWFFTSAGTLRKIYGGLLLENVVQALARIVVMDAAIQIRKRTGRDLALQAHDELGYVVPDDRVDEMKLILLEEMGRPPAWAPDLPLKAEAGHGQTYGDAK